MERQIIWTEQASGDIEAIVRYIARRDPNAAGRIGMGIYDRVQILHENPEAGSLLNELRAGGWRKLVFRRWKISIPSERKLSLLEECGRLLWERRTWKRRYKTAPGNQ